MPMTKISDQLTVCENEDGDTVLVVKEDAVEREETPLLEGRPSWRITVSTDDLFRYLASVQRRRLIEAVEALPDDQLLLGIVSRGINTTL
jgi:hypothetical protein